MIVHFAVPTSGVEKNITMYKAVIQAVHEHGDILARDWILPAYYRKDPREETHNYRSTTEQILSEIDRADVIIADASDNDSFGIGYQTAIALQKKKPVLLLQRKDEIGGVMVRGLRDELLTYKVVDKDSVGDIVGAFLRANTINIKDLRFNFVIDRQIYNYLRTKSHELGKTKAELVRDLLIRDIEKSQ